MYIDYFSLASHPFRITPDPDLFFPGGGRGAVLEALAYAITSGEGIVKVVGEVGSGKTMLCRMLAQRLPASVEIVYLANPSLSPLDILYAIAFELKLPVERSTERLVVMQLLQEYLLKQHAAGHSVVVFVEEAQGMALETLEEIRLLSNLETHRSKLLQIVLFGQPELDKKLRMRNIRQLRERITHSFYLGAFAAAETRDYLRFRLHAAGCTRPGVFSDGAERLIARASGGLSRRINILADKALLAAYAEAAFTVKPRHVRAAVRDSEFGGAVLFLRWNMAIGLVILALGLVGALLRFSDGFPPIWNVSAAAPPVSAAAVPPADTLHAAHPASVAMGESLPEESLFGQRLAAGRQWLSAVTPDSYTIQLVTVFPGSDAVMERFLAQARQEGLLNDIYACPVSSGEDPGKWMVVFKAFPEASAARVALAELPPSLCIYQPFVRNILTMRGGTPRLGRAG